MKIKRQIINTFIAVCVILSLSILYAAFIDSNRTYHADDAELTNKRYCTATIDDGFSDNEIVVVMNDSAENVITYDKTDFPEVKLENVKDLTQTLKDMLCSGEADDNKMFAKENFKSILKLTLSQHDKQNVLDTIKVLEKRSDILSTEPNYIMKSEEAAVEYYPDNAQFVNDNSWSLRGANGINIDEAWKITTGSSDVKVAVVDSGIDITHSELAGIVDETISYDYPSGKRESALYDYSGHGTHVSGIIGAKCNNGIGIDGINQNISLVSLVIDDGDAVICSQLIVAISHAIRDRIPIINFSSGRENYTKDGGSYVDYDRDISYLEYMLLNYTGLFVNSAGNTNQCIDGNKNIFPATASADNFIAVGALNRNGKRWVDSKGGSNYGNEVDIYAPGSDLISTHPARICNEALPGDKREEGHFGTIGYHIVAGTSIAAPFVTGVAALMLSVNPELSGAELKSLILNNSDNISITLPNGSSQTVKKLNAGKAVKAAYIEPYYEIELLDDGTLEIVGVTGVIAHELTIPSIMYERPITSIGVGVFKNCKRLKKLMFASDSALKNIDAEAFYGCENLKSVAFPNNGCVVEIGSSCFNNTSSELKLYVPANLYDEYVANAVGETYAGNFVKS